MLKAIALNIIFFAGDKFGREIKKIFAQHKKQKPVIITEEMLQKLPDPVKRYLTGCLKTRQFLQLNN